MTYQGEAFVLLSFASMTPSIQLAVIFLLASQDAFCQNDMDKATLSNPIPKMDIDTDQVCIMKRSFLTIWLFLYPTF